MPFACIKSCPEKYFPSRRSLGVHQARCEYIQKEDVAYHALSAYSEDTERGSKCRRIDLEGMNDENVSINVPF